LGNVNKAVYNNEESEVLNIEDIPVAIGGSSKERDHSLQKEKETGHGCSQLHALEIESFSVSNDGIISIDN
jgi:hypothetical protein